MQQQTYQGAVMTFANFDDGSKSVVLFWVPQASLARGFGLVDGKCLALENVNGFAGYEVQ